MIVPVPDILKFSKEDVDDWINKAREDNRVNKVHYYGEGSEDHLRKIDGIEGDNEFEIRKRYHISNQWITEGLFRPFDSVFTAKGAMIDVDLPMDSVKDTFLKLLKDVKSGLSVQEYMKTIWKDAFITDPCGLSFIEVKRDGSSAYLTQKSIQSIRKMRLHGISPEYVMFEADVVIDDLEKEKNPDKQDESYALHWFVDDIKYYRLKVYKDKDLPTEIIEEKENGFECVPGVVNSSIIDTNRKIKISPFHKQIGLLDKYLRNGSVHEVFLAKHGFPVFWAYGSVTEMCKTCSGQGTIDDQDRGTSSTCGNCKGQGWKYKKDVSDVILLNPPTSKDAPTITPNVAGYNGPDKSVSEDQRTEENWTRNNIHYSLWGTTEEKDKSETATGRFLDSQPVMNRLNDFADIVDLIGTELINLFAKWYVPMSYRGGKFSVGRRFMIETPDQIWKKYINAKKDGSSEIILNQLLRQYYETEYQANDLVRDYYLKLIQVDPLPHNTIQEVIDMNVPEDFKDKKLYFNDYIHTKTMVEIIDRPLDVIEQDFSEFINTKKNDTEKGNTGEGGEQGAGSSAAA